jgi:hypothetical protein
LATRNTDQRVHRFTPLQNVEAVPHRPNIGAPVRRVPPPPENDAPPASTEPHPRSAISGVSRVSSRPSTAIEMPPAVPAPRRFLGLRQLPPQLCKFRRSGKLAYGCGRTYETGRSAGHGRARPKMKGQYTVKDQV